MRAETRLKDYNNSWYKPAGKVKILAWFLTNTLFLNNYLPIPVAIKRGILRLFGAKIGVNVMIKPKVNIKYPWFLTIANDVWIGEGVWIDNYTEVVIENNVCLSQGAMLLTGNHNYKKTGFDLMIGGIHLKKGVWIGAKAIVCPNVICESHSVLTVASVATKNMEEYSIYQGNPAVHINNRALQ
jgi:putative colanic acid biosynthesis acetyltransferase WcaF